MIRKGHPLDSLCDPFRLALNENIQSLTIIYFARELDFFSGQLKTAGDFGRKPERNPEGKYCKLGCARAGCGILGPVCYSF